MSPTTCVSVCSVRAMKKKSHRRRDAGIWCQTYGPVVDVMRKSFWFRNLRPDWVHNSESQSASRCGYLTERSCKLGKAKKKSRTTSTSTPNIQLWQECLITVIEVISKECYAKSSRNKRHSACTLSHWTIQKWLNYRLASPIDDNNLRASLSATVANWCDKRFTHIPSTVVESYFAVCH